MDGVGAGHGVSLRAAPDGTGVFGGDWRRVGTFGSGTRLRRRLTRRWAVTEASAGAVAEEAARRGGASQSVQFVPNQPVGRSFGAGCALSAHLVTTNPGAPRFGA